MIGGCVVQMFAGTAGFTAIFDICGFLLLGALVFFLFTVRKTSPQMNQRSKKGENYAES